jgi:hypothetical protein
MVLRQPDRLGGEPAEPTAELLLAERPDLPGLGGLVLIGDRKNEAAQLRVLRADALFAFRLVALELSPR